MTITVLYRHLVSHEELAVLENEYLPQKEDPVVLEGEQWQVVRSVYYAETEKAIVDLNPHGKIEAGEWSSAANDGGLSEAGGENHANE